MYNLPPYKKKLVLSYPNAITGDIIDTLNKCFPQAKRDVLLFAEQFRGQNDYETAYNVWKYVRENVKYKRDPDGIQVIQHPPALIRRGLKTNGGGDCKSMSLCISSILSALNVKNVQLRYVSFKPDFVPTHVYSIFEYNNRIVPVDSVLTKFDYEKPFTYKKDYKMNVYQLSGVSDSKYLIQLQRNLNAQKDGSFCKFLIQKEIRKTKGMNDPIINLNPIQFKNYERKLISHINAHEKNKKFGLCYDLKRQELNNLRNNQVTLAIAGDEEFIGKAGRGREKLKKAFSKVKKVALSPERNAFLLLIKVNLLGMATRLANYPDKKKLQKTWESIGGSWKNLQKEIERGSKKSRIMGIEDDAFLGAEPTSSAVIITASAPIVAMFLKFLGADKTKKKVPQLDKDGKPVLDANGQPVMVDEKIPLLDQIKNVLPGVADALNSGYQAITQVVDQNPDGTTTTKDDVDITDAKNTGFKIDPKILMIGGAGLVALLLLSKKK
jgi:hypothetical protein